MDCCRDYAINIHSCHVLNWAMRCVKLWYVHILHCACTVEYRSKCTKKALHYGHARGHTIIFHLRTKRNIMVDNFVFVARPPISSCLQLIKLYWLRSNSSQTLLMALYQIHGKQLLCTTYYHSVFSNSLFFFLASKWANIYHASSVSLVFA